VTVVHTKIEPNIHLDLLKRCLTRMIDREEYKVVRGSGVRGVFYRPLRRLLERRRLVLARRVTVDPERRLLGMDWPLNAETMIGMRRLDNLQQCVADVIAQRVPGDLIETGVWRGGAAIFMRAALEAYGDVERYVWVADSFQGLPQPDPDRYPADEGIDLWKIKYLAVSVEEVKANFERYGLLDDRVRFLVGWFKDTLPKAPIDKLAVMRLDGDLYESTMDALVALYPKLSVGGYVIIDDYGDVPACKAAVEDFRAKRGIDEAMQQVDWTCWYWKRLRAPLAAG
jgi:O-methyltransferase